MIDNFPTSAAGDEAIARAGRFEDFFAAHYASAVRGAYLLTFRADAAEDIAQDVFADLLRRWGTIRRPGAYLWRAITNGARAWGRKHRRPPPAWRVDQIQAPFDSDSIAVRDALAGLTHAQREALVLRYYAAFREREIADATGRPIGTVKSDLRRGLAALKEALQ